MQSIYQAYVDAVQGNLKTQQMKQELALNQTKLNMENISLAQQLQERELTAQIIQQYQSGDQNQAQQQAGANGAAQSQPGGAGNPQTGPYSVAGGSTPNANPTTGDDPSLKQAAMYDTLAAKLGPINPKAALEYSTKAREIRNSYYTRTKEQLAISKEQGEMVANIYGSVDSQESYTEALVQLQSRGIDIGKFGLTGVFSVDEPKLKSLAQQSMTFAQKTTAAHQAVQEQISRGTLDEKIRHDHVDEGLANARVNLETTRQAADAEWKKWDMGYKSRAEARAQAGLDQRGEEALGKDKHYAQTPNPKTDGPYIDALIAADPNLSMLSDKQKQAVKAEINLTARNQLGEKVKKPGDTPSWNDFMDAADKAAKQVAKRVTPGSSGFLGFGSTKATVAPRPGSNAQPKEGGPLPATITSMSQLTSKSPGDQVTIGGKIYKVTKKGSKPDGSDTELAEIK